jgi:hypothetical protein
MGEDRVRCAVCGARYQESPHGWGKGWVKIHSKGYRKINKV